MNVKTNNIAGAITSIREEQARIREAAELEIADLEKAVAILEKRPQNGVASEAESYKKPTESQSRRPSEEASILGALKALHGRATIDLLYGKLVEQGYAFGYAMNQKHGLSVGLSNARHKFTEVGYDEDRKEYFVK